MGYVLQLNERQTTATSPYYVTVARLIREVDRLNSAWDGNLDASEVNDVCQRTAEQLGLDTSAGSPMSWPNRKYEIPANGALVKGGPKNKLIWYFVPGVEAQFPPGRGDDFWDKRNCVAVEVVEKSAYELQGKKMICPSCKREVKVANTSLAHNVISQRFWKDVIDAVFESFPAVVQSGVVNGNDIRGRVKSYKTLTQNDDRPFKVMSQAEQASIRQDAKDQKSAELYAGRDRSAVGKNEQKRISKDAKKHADEELRSRLPDPEGDAPYMPPSADAQNQAFVERFLADSMLEKSRYAASDHAGRQCRDCEEGQGNATLLQRHQLEKDGLLPDIITNTNGKLLNKDAFVGAHMKAAANREIEIGRHKIKAFSNPDEAMKQMTLAQISRYLYGVEKTIGNIWDESVRFAQKTQRTSETGQTAVLYREHFAPLLLLVVDNMDLFIWHFRAVALRVAGVPYIGGFGKMKIEDGKKV